MRITNKSRPIFPYKIDNSPIEYVETQKFVGINYDVKMKFNVHTDLIM